MVPYPESRNQNLDSNQGPKISESRGGGLARRGKQPEEGLASGWEGTDSASNTHTQTSRRRRERELKTFLDNTVQSDIC